MKSVDVLFCLKDTLVSAGGSSTVTCRFHFPK